MDFELVNKMKVEELETYLRLRGLKVSGRKVELVARVFAASENNVQPVKTAEEVEAEIADENKAKLSLKGFVLPQLCPLVRNHVISYIILQLSVNTLWLPFCAW